MSTITFTLLWNAGLATALAILVGLVSRSKMLQCRPGLTHSLWLLVLFKFITPPLIPLPVLPGLKADEAEEQSQQHSSNVNTAEEQPLLRFVDADPFEFRQKPRDRGEIDDTNVASSPRVASEQRATRKPLSIPWSTILISASASGTVILITSSLRQVVRVSRILRRATSRDDWLTELAGSAATRMGVSRIPMVCAVDASIVPLLWVRWSGPVIVMPTSLSERMRDEQLMCIFCHELGHYVRRDHWSNAIAFLVATLFWWHPVTWWARREMRAAQELCCDGLVLARGAATRRCYAETLFQALEFVQTRNQLHAALVSGFGDSASLKRRFEMIASLKVSRRLSWWAAAFVVACVAATLCVPVRGLQHSRSRRDAMLTNYADRATICTEALAHLRIGDVDGAIAYLEQHADMALHGVPNWRTFADVPEPGQLALSQAKVYRTSYPTKDPAVNWYLRDVPPLAPDQLSESMKRLIADAPRAQ